jgi:hypothetical protein
MKCSSYFPLTAIGILGLAICAGCAGLKEAGKGFIGVSTKVLEDERVNSLKQSFALDHNRCYARVKEVLNQKIIQEDNQEAEKPYIYAQDSQQKMIALYLSAVDTTPVGIFFTVQADGATLVEVSSPSLYAQEEIAGRIFAGLHELINPKAKKE